MNTLHLIGLAILGLIAISLLAEHCNRRTHTARRNLDNQGTP